jgi:hypothetical protein
VKPEVAAEVRKLMERLLDSPEFQGNKTALGRKIGVTQSAVTQQLSGGGISRETAIAVANLSGVHPSEVLGEMETLLVGRYPNLELCLQYHLNYGKTWPISVVTAARAGWYSTDCDSEQWAKRLEAMTAAQASLDTADREGATVIPLDSARPPKKKGNN